LSQSTVAGRAEIPIRWIVSNDQLVVACKELSRHPVIAMDTEFVRERTFYPIAALIQVYDGQTVYLVDPASCDDYTPFKTLLLNPAVTKVLHSCSEDLEVFKAMLDAVPANVFDTQLACAFLGGGLSLGYHKLVLEQFGVELPKTETRSDWMQRPLSQSQVDYAVDDVRYLITLYETQRSALEANGKWEWFASDSEQLLQAADRGNNFSDYYKKIKGAWKCSSRELALLQRLCEWRERECRRRDMPRGWVLHDNTLRSIVAEQPDSPVSLADIEGVNKGTVKRYGEFVLEQVEAVSRIPESELPPRLPAPPGRDKSSLMKSLKAFVSNRAEQLGIAPELLARKKDYEAMVQRNPDPHSSRLCSGWRQALIGNDMLMMVEESGA
jgi:ribonuclease D